MTRIGAIALACALLAGCTLEGVKQPSSEKPAAAAPAPPKGWRQTGTMAVDGQQVPVYSETYRGEGQSELQMARNPRTGKVQRFVRDEGGNVIWKMDPMEPSGQ